MTAAALPRGDKLTPEFRRGAVRVRALLIAMAAVAATAAAVGTAVMYRAALAEQRESLRKVARSQAVLIDSVARFDFVQSQDASPFGAWVATLAQVARGFASRGERGDLTLWIVGPARDRLVVHVRDGELFAPEGQALPAEFPEARLRAELLAAGNELEYRSVDGRSFLLWHEPIPTLGMAVLARVDLAAVRRPLMQSLWISGLGAVILIALALVVSRKTSVRVVESLATELALAEKELLARERLATLGQITAKVSHELRNPLATLRTSLFTLRERTKDQTASLDTIFERLERNVWRCDRIIEELLSYTRPRALEPVRFDASRLLEDVLSEYRPAAGVTIESALEPSVELTADPEDLRRMLLNVLNNAVDATLARGDGAEPIRLGLSRRSEDVLLTVEDRGLGMQKDVLDRAFEPLFSTKGFGIGLGLPIVRELADRNGIDVTIESRVGSGTVVRFRFPRAVRP